MKTNYLAVAVAAIAYWILGALWFGVLFAKAWMQLERISPEQVAAMQRRIVDRLQFNHTVHQRAGFVLHTGVVADRTLKRSHDG